MKIGQLTFHASHNYGSVLQAYALSRQISLHGHQTEFINLRPQSQKDTYPVISGRGVHRIYRYLHYPSMKRRHSEFERFITKVLPVTKEEYATTEELKTACFDYDAYVCGGDQIWNPECQDYETAYYLQFLSPKDSVKRISYAPSFGKTEFDEKTLSDIGRWVQHFDSISVRERQGAELLQRVSGKKVQTVCDPVILLEMDEWKRLAKQPKFKKPYILVYFLENNHGARSLSEHLRKTLGYDVVQLNEYVRDAFKPYHWAFGASPEEFVGLFLNASFVYTNSFHGTAFATIFEKPFLTAIAADQKNARNNNDSRKIDFLQLLGLESRLYTSGTPDKDALLSIDFSEARMKLENIRNDSLTYLKNALDY